MVGDYCFQPDGGYPRVAHLYDISEEFGHDPLVEGVVWSLIPKTTQILCKQSDPVPGFEYCAVSLRNKSCLCCK